MEIPRTLETVECETGTNPQWAVLWLHGLGADGHDFSPIVPELVRADWPAVRFVFPHAPVRAVTVNNGMRMRAWYDIRNFSADEMASDGRIDSVGLLEAVDQVEALIAREAARGIPAQRVILVGFSQGGAVTLVAGLRRATPLAGLVALSTYLPMAQQAHTDMRSGAQAQPLFIAHGKDDPVVPASAGERSAGLMRGLGFDVDWHLYPMAHSICAEEIGDLGDWLGRRFASA